MQRSPVLPPAVSHRWPQAQQWEGRCAWDHRCTVKENRPLVVLSPIQGELRVFHDVCWQLHLEQLQRDWQTRCPTGVPADPLALALLRLWWDRVPVLTWLAPKTFRLELQGRAHELPITPELALVAHGLWQAVWSARQPHPEAQQWLTARCTLHKFVFGTEEYRHVALASTPAPPRQAVLQDCNPFPSAWPRVQLTPCVAFEEDPLKGRVTVFVNCVPLRPNRPVHLRVSGSLTCVSLELNEMADVLVPTWPTREHIQLLPRSVVRTFGPLQTV